MTTITHGSKYEQTKGLRTVEIAKLIRADIKAAIQAGELPKGLKTSVRYESFAGGCAIRVSVTAVPDDFVYWRPEFIAFEAANPHTFFQGERVTEEAKALLAKLKEIHSAYNFDGSDIQSDYFHVRYYGDVKFGWEIERDDRKRTIERMAAHTKAAAVEAEERVTETDRRVAESQARLEAAERRAAELEAEIAAATVVRNAVLAEMAALRGQHAGAA